VPKPAGYPVFLKTVRQKGAHGAAFGYNALQATHERGASAVSSTVAASLLRVGNRHQRQRSSQRKKGWRTSKSALTMLHQFGFIAYES
jgi:hypothetical protein